MFALSTNYSNTQIPNAMNKFFSSAFAAMLAFSAIGAQAGTNIITCDNLVQVTEVQSTQDLAVSVSVTMRIKADRMTSPEEVLLQKQVACLRFRARELLRAPSDLQGPTRAWRVDGAAVSRGVLPCLLRCLALLPLSAA